jgi:hypothetical protein
LVAPTGRGSGGRPEDRRDRRHHSAEVSRRKRQRLLATLAA